MATGHHVAVVKGKSVAQGRFVEEGWPVAEGQFVEEGWLIAEGRPVAERSTGKSCPQAAASSGSAEGRHTAGRSAKRRRSVARGRAVDERNEDRSADLWLARCCF